MAHGFLSSCGTGSEVAACRLSWPAACGILVPRPGIELASPAVEGRFLTTGPPGKSLEFCFSIKLSDVLLHHLQVQELHFMFSSMSLDLYVKPFIIFFLDGFKEES